MSGALSPEILGAILWFALIFGLLASFWLVLRAQRSKILLEILEDVQSSHWPISWTRLCNFPIFGRRLYLAAREQFNTNPILRVHNPLIETDRSFELPPSPWLLFIEHYDRRGGEHHGTQILPLDTSKHYQLIPAHDPQPAQQKDGFIYLSVPRRMPGSRLNQPWAQLAFKDHWQIHNVSRGECVIPIFQTRTKDDHRPETFRFVTSDIPNSDRLSPDESFIVGFAECQLVRLPQLAIFREDFDRQINVPIPQEKIIYLGFHRNDLIVGKRDRGNDASVGEVQIFHQSIRSVKGKDFFFESFIDGKQIEIERGKRIPLTPGDRFGLLSYPNRTFYVDYL